MSYPYQQYKPNFAGSVIPRIRPVSSVDEVRNAIIDFDGSIFYFPDMANKKIYTKQINMDGTSALYVYELVAPQPQITTDYITREEFSLALENLTKKLQGPQDTKSEKKEDTPEFNF